MKKPFSNPAPESPSAARYGARILSYLPHILALLFIFAFAVFAWQEPSQQPPQGNAPAPINVSNTDQSKLGGLGLGGGVGQALQWFKNIGGTLHIQSQSGTSSVVIGQDGKVGIGTTTPSQKLDVVGTLKTVGFMMPTGAAAGRVLTSDVSGLGVWQAPAPDKFGGSTLVNYGIYYSGFSFVPSNFASPCPSGWTEAGSGGYFMTAGGWPPGSSGNAYRTCFRTDMACLTLVNYGAYNPQYPGGYSASPCPSGWTEAGLGYHMEYVGSSGPLLYNQYVYPAYRTCFLCQ